MSYKLHLAILALAATSGCIAQTDPISQTDLGDTYAPLSSACPGRGLPRPAHEDYAFDAVGHHWRFDVDLTYGATRYSNYATDGSYSEHGTLNRWPSCPGPNQTVQLIRSDGASKVCTRVCLPSGVYELHCPNGQFELHPVRSDSICEGPLATITGPVTCTSCLDDVDAALAACLAAAGDSGQAHLDCWRQRNRGSDQCVNDVCGGCTNEFWCSQGPCVDGVCIDTTDGGIPAGSPPHGAPGGGSSSCVIGGGDLCPAACFYCSRLAF